MILHALAVLTLAASPDTGKKVTVVIDAGLVNVSGNSNVTTLSGDDKIGIKLGQWAIGQTFAVAYAETNDSTTASSLHAGLRGDRSLAKRVSVFVLTEFDRDRFSGIASRFSPSAGLAAVLLPDSANLFRVELGAGYTWQNAVTPNPDRQFGTARAAFFYHHKLGAKSAFDQTVEVIPGFDNSSDVRVNSETSVSAPITTGVALKAGYVIHFAGLPEPGFKKTDRILTTGIQVTL